MKVEGNYERDGYALLRELISVEVARAFMTQLKNDLPPGPIAPTPGELSPVLKRHATEIYSGDYPLMDSFLWGLTTTITEVAGRRLVPTYCYFRLYREGDICRVHSDRPSCEHSVSLTLDYSDGVVWPLEVATQRSGRHEKPITDSFGSEPHKSLAMQIGDAVLYKGTMHRHGRVSPNPNGWSAHLFLHWVEPDGPNGAYAFDGAGIPKPVNFTFA